MMWGEMQVIIASYHKTGTELIRGIFKQYRLYDNTFDFQFNDHFNYVSNNKIKTSKCVVIIRHPYELLMSAVRWHETDSKKIFHTGTNLNRDLIICHTMNISEQ